jgi:hypothetical protein
VVHLGVEGVVSSKLVSTGTEYEQINYKLHESRFAAKCCCIIGQQSSTVLEQGMYVLVAVLSIFFINSMI